MFIKLMKNPSIMKLKLSKEQLILIGLFLLVIIVRIIFKNGSVFHWDTLKDVLVIEDILKTGEFQYSYAYGAPGMIAFVFVFYWLHNLFTGALSAEGAYFFATFLTAGLSTVLLYIITKKITKDKFISISSALIFSFNTIFLSATTYPKTHSIALFFTLMSFYLIFLHYNKKSAWLLALSGVFFGLSVAVRILNILMFLPILYIYLNPRKEKSIIKIKKSKLSIKNFLYFAIPALLTWYLLFYKKIKELGGFWNYLNSLFIEQGAAVGWQGFFSSSLKTSLSYLYTSMSLLGSILLLVGIWYGFKKYKKISILLAIWIIPLFLYFGNISLPQARFFIIILPALSIFIAFGSKYIYNKNKLLGILAVLIVVLSTFSIAYPIIKYRHDYSGPKEFASWVVESTEENSVVITNDAGWFIEYYGNRTIITHPRSGNDMEIQEFIEELKNYTENNIEIYATQEGLALDPGQKVLIAIDNNFDIEIVGEKETEIYQYSELELRKYDEKLFHLVPKN
jgi:4-amino-4-deoxy-L-arabinose transferase-like glycosyltransferase